MTWGSQEGSGDEPEPALRGGGLPLPGLKRWRLRRGLSQAKLARRAELTTVRASLRGVMRALGA